MSYVRFYGSKVLLIETSGGFESVKRVPKIHTLP